MQLNNKINRKYIRVTDVNIQKNRIFYSVFDVENNKVHTGCIDFNINLYDLIFTQGLNENAVYNLIADKFSEYVLENDNQCWLSEHKNKRFYIPNSLVINSIKDDTPFKTAIDKIVADSNIDATILIIEANQNTIVYANSIDNSVEGIVMQYVRSITDEYGIVIYHNEYGVIDIEYKRIQN